MKTFEVESTKAVTTRTFVKARTALEARKAVKNGNTKLETFTVDERVSNTVSSVHEV